MKQPILQSDPLLSNLLERETARQRDTLEMIASESIQSDELLMLAGSVFNNKTAVGLPGHQRLIGSAIADELEALTAERACRVFGADHANINPYSGSVANYCELYNLPDRTQFGHVRVNPGNISFTKISSAVNLTVTFQTAAKRSSKQQPRKLRSIPHKPQITAICLKRSFPLARYSPKKQSLAKSCIKHTTQTTAHR